MKFTPHKDPATRHRINAQKRNELAAKWMSAYYTAMVEGRKVDLITPFQNNFKSRQLHLRFGV